MLEQLTPEQAFELCAYHGIEPFGEVRDDLRMDKILRIYIDSHRKKGTKPLAWGSMAMYQDIVESSQEAEGSRDLQAHLASMGATSE